MASLAAIRPDLLVGFAAELHPVGAGKGAEAAGQVVGQPGEQAQVGGSVELPGEATAVLQRYLPQARFADMENPSRFHCHSRVARAFRAGSVFLAGNAAHVCSPAEGHGMNAGLQDAANLAWRLALVHHGVASPALLDSYGQERRPVAQQICRSGDATEAAHGLREPAERAVRDRAIAALLADPAARPTASPMPSARASGSPSPCWRSGRTVSSACGRTPITSGRCGGMGRWCWTVSRALEKLAA